MQAGGIRKGQMFNWLKKLLAVKWLRNLAKTAKIEADKDLAEARSKGEIPMKNLPPWAQGLLAAAFAALVDQAAQLVQNGSFDKVSLVRSLTVVGVAVLTYLKGLYTPQPPAK